MSQDIERFLSNEPITARPPSAVYRFKKFAQRNRARLVPAIIVAVVLMIGLTFALTAAFDARRAKDALAYKTARGLYASQMRDGIVALQMRDYGAVEDYLAKTTPADNSPDFRGWESYYLQKQSLRPFAEAPPGHVTQAAWRPRHNHAAVCVARRNHQAIELWKPESQSLLRELIILRDVRPDIMRWSDDGTRLALGNWKGRAIVLDVASGETVFDRELYQGIENSGGMKAIDLSPSGTTLVSASFYIAIILWDVNEKERIAEADGSDLQPLDIDAITAELAQELDASGQPK